jgi:hypothetical protein
MSSTTKPNNAKPNWATVYDDDYSSEVTVEGF